MATIRKQNQNKITKSIAILVMIVHRSRLIYLITKYFGKYRLLTCNANRFQR